MGRFEHPGSSFTKVIHDLTETVHADAYKKNVKQDWRYERRCLARCFRGNVRFKGNLWTVWQVFKIWNDGTEEPHSSKTIRLDVLQYQNNSWWHTPIGTEADGLLDYNCPLKYLQMCRILNNRWRDEVLLNAAIRRERQVKKNVKRKTQKAIAGDYARQELLGLQIETEPYV